MTPYQNCRNTCRCYVEICGPTLGIGDIRRGEGNLLMTYSLAKSEAISLPSFFIGAALADTGSSLYKFLVRGPRSSTDFFSAKNENMSCHRKKN